MAEVAQQSVDVNHHGGRKRKIGGKKKGKMGKKRPRMNDHSKAKKIDKKTKKLFEKRAREYNSDDDDEQEDEEEFTEYMKKQNEKFEIEASDGEGEEGEEDEGELGFKHGGDEASEDEDGGIQPGVTKFSEGITAFKLAFKKIVKKSGDDDDVLGPVLSAHKKLLAEKLAEEDAEKKVKGEVKKEKLMIREKGHVQPAKYLNAHEKYLLGVATKGVVKLFNAVNKAQNAQKGLNPSRSKDEKVIKKRRTEAFFSELKRTSSKSAGNAFKDGTSNGSEDGEAPAWAALRDNYMLTNPKLKDWDKMQDTNDAEDFGRQSDGDSSSGED